jgi:hypothetical protein
MALTLSQAITEARDHLNEASAVFWSDSQLTKWIQEGTRIVAAKALCVEADDSVTLIANTLLYNSSTGAGYTWIADCIEPYAAYYDDASNNYKGLIKVHPRELGNVATFTAGSPKYYCLHNRNLYIWPLTTAAIVTAGGVVMFLYAKETDDITELKDEHQHLAINYAVGKAKMRDRAFGESSALINQVYQELQFARADKHDREVDTLDMFKIQGRDQGARRR